MRIKTFLCTSCGHRGNGGINPCVLDLGSKSCYVVCFMLRQLHPQGKIALDTLSRKLSRPQLLSGDRVDKPLVATGIEQRTLGLSFWLNCLILKCKQHECEYFLNKKELPTSLETQAWVVLPFLSRNMFVLFSYSDETYIHLILKKTLLPMSQTVLTFLSLKLRLRAIILQRKQGCYLLHAIYQ
jgi:hypothetical protein